MDEPGRVAGPVRVALVGYGFSGATFHAPVIGAVADLELATIVTSRPAKALADWPRVRTVAEMGAVLQDPAIDLVVITSPNAEHHPQARAALDAGKHVVVEKPFTLDTREAEDLDALARDRGRVLSAYHNRRWDGDFLTLRQVIDSGLLGSVHSYEAHFDRFRLEVRDRWRERDLPGSGMLYDLGPHLIDQALVLFGHPRSVFADLRRQRPGARTTDSFHLLLDYPERRVVLSAGMLVRDPGPHFEIHGDRGSFVKYGLDPQEEALKEGGAPGGTGWGMDAPERFGTLTTEVDGLAVERRIPTAAGCYQEYYLQVARAILGAGPPPVTASQARDCIRVIELAQESQRTGRRVDWV